MNTEADVSKIPARAVRLVLICQDPPPPEIDGRPAEFGLQDAHRTLHPGEVLADGAQRFELQVAVKAHAATGAPDFGSPFVHGPALGRFLYLGWRPIGDELWTRRYKIPLAAITWQLLDRAGPEGALVARASAAERAATLTLLAGWETGDPYGSHQ
jgi:hypothetical protein